MSSNSIVQNMHVMRRKEKAKTENIKIEYIDHSSKDHRSYRVRGTTNNIHTVILSTCHKCTCSDYTINNLRCKHIYYILNIIYKSELFSNLKQLTHMEVEILFSLVNKKMVTLRAASNEIMVSCDYDEMYLGVYYHRLNRPAIVRKRKRTSRKYDTEVKLKFDKHTNCPICLDVMSLKDIWFCKIGCGQSVHKNCFIKYSTMLPKTKVPKCVLCRRRWVNQNVGSMLDDMYFFS